MYELNGCKYTKMRARFLQLTPNEIEIMNEITFTSGRIEQLCLTMRQVYRVETASGISRDLRGLCID